MFPGGINDKVYILKQHSISFVVFFQEEKYNEYRKQQRKNKKERRRGKLGEDEGTYGGGEDSDMAAIMGFGGFGGSKKN